MALVIDPFTRASQAIVTRLRDVFPEKDAPECWQIEHVPDPLSLQEFTALASRLPFMGLSWRQFAPSAQSASVLDGKVGLRLTIVVGNSRGRQHRFFGDERGTGLYPAMTAAAYLLQGLKIPEVGSVAISALAQAYAEGFNNQNAAIATLDIEIHTSLFDAIGEGDALPAFSSLLSDIKGNALDDGVEQEPIEVPT